MSFRPPLVEQLFKHEGSFNAILHNYPKAEQLATTIRRRIRRGESLEGLLREYFAESRLPLKKQCWQVPFYLQELLGEVSQHCVRTGGTKFAELIHAIERSDYDEVIYVTVNYDLFLDKELERFYSIEFLQPRHYLQPDHHWSLIKLHGSVNWGRRIQNAPGPFPTVLQLLDSLDSDPALDGLDEIRVVGTHQLRSKSPTKEGFFYPAIAVPIEGKADFSCHQSLVEHTRVFFRDCSDFLFIGFSARDAHVLSLLESVQRVRKFAIVSGHQTSGNEAIGRIRRVNSQFDPSRRFPHVDDVIKIGFLSFVNNGELERFLSL